MGQLALAAAKSLLDLAQAVRTSQLAKQHRDELLPAADASGVPLRIEFMHLTFEVGARNELENLAEQTAESVHVEPLCCGPKRFGSRASLHAKAQRPSANLDDSDEKDISYLTAVQIGLNSEW
jgi:hypothetical protein